MDERPSKLVRHPAQALSPADGGALVSKLAPEILHRWEDRVRESVPAACHQDRLMLFDEIPLFLARVAQTLSGKISLKHDDICREHGEQRALEAKYPINGVIQEYRILRKTICEILEEEAPLEPAAREAITDIIEVAIQEAADRYVDVQHGHLVESDRLKDEFVATLAHELRTPLSAVANAAYILQNIELDERAARQLQIVNRQVGNLNRLVQDIMDVARITQNKLEIHREPVSLDSVVRDACESVRPACDARGQDLYCTLPPDPLVVEGDPVRLEQVVVNLLNNATTYTPAGGTIWLELGIEADEAVIRVRDSGVGIAPVMLPQIFDLFAQVEGERPRSGGLGIGLALVKRLVTMHSGSVTANSDGEDQGTEFVVRLPVTAGYVSPDP